MNERRKLLGHVLAFLMGVALIAVVLCLLVWPCQSERWCSAHTHTISAAVGIVLFLTLLAVLWYASLTRELLNQAKHPAVSFAIVGDAEELRLFLRNHTCRGAVVRLHMKAYLMGSSVKLDGVYGGEKDWVLLPYDRDQGAAFLLSNVIRKSCPDLAKELGRNHLTNPAVAQLQELKDWEQNAPGQGAVSFEVAVTATTHGTHIHDTTPTRKWYYNFTKQQLVLDV